MQVKPEEIGRTFSEFEKESIVLETLLMGLSKTNDNKYLISAHFAKKDPKVVEKLKEHFLLMGWKDFVEHTVEGQGPVSMSYFELQG